MRNKAETLEEASVLEQNNMIISNVYNSSPKINVETILSVCNDILLQPEENLAFEDKDILMKAMTRYLVMKR